MSRSRRRRLGDAPRASPLGVSTVGTAFRNTAVHGFAVATKVLLPNSLPNSPLLPNSRLGSGVTTAYSIP
jgi:hypothetical protein